MTNAAPPKAPERAGTIRPLATPDVPAMKLVIDGTGFFRSALLQNRLAGHLGGAGGEEMLAFEPRTRDHRHSNGPTLRVS